MQAILLVALVPQGESTHIDFLEERQLKSGEDTYRSEVLAHQKDYFC